jgi:hypothetical protein
MTYIRKSGETEQDLAVNVIPLIGTIWIQGIPLGRIPTQICLSLKIPLHQILLKAASLWLSC